MTNELEINRLVWYMGVPTSEFPYILAIYKSVEQPQDEVMPNWITLATWWNSHDFDSPKAVYELAVKVAKEGLNDDK